MITALVLALPWLGLIVFLLAAVRLPPELPRVDSVTGDSASGGREAGARGDDDALPFVSVIIPARNEARSIERVVSSLAASRYPTFEIIVVDDRSEDDTATLARSVGIGNAKRIEVVDGASLPEGWLGKPWACAQGAERAKGDALLFTDADTVHGENLLGRAIGALDVFEVDVVTIGGRQLMGTFWERLIQPQIFTAMVVRYFNQAKPLPARKWRSAIANGQFILFRRPVYDDFGGHERVRDAVVEDLRIAQLLVRSGRRLAVCRAEGDFATRMYRSLSELVAGWSKNIVLGGLQTYPPWVRPFVPALSLFAGSLLWCVPVLVGGAALVGWVAEPWASASALIVAISVLFWCTVSHRFGVPWYYGLLYPLGAAVSLWIVLRSWVGMRTVQWKGRTYSTALPND